VGALVCTAEAASAAGGATTTGRPTITAVLRKIPRAELPPAIVCSNTELQARNGEIYIHIDYSRNEVNI
jgi:hypothetical protein